MFGWHIKYHIGLFLQPAVALDRLHEFEAQAAIHFGDDAPLGERDAGGFSASEGAEPQEAMNGGAEGGGL